MTKDPDHLDFDGLRPPCPGLDEAHVAWREQLRSFVDTHITPSIDDWNAAATFPDELYTQAADAGLLGFGFPAEFGGWQDEPDLYHRILFAEEFHRLGSGVVFADLATHWIALPPVVKHGSAELQETVTRPVLAGEKRMAFAITEPGGGSDVARMTTTAAKNGSGYRVNGTKTLISGALRADYLLIVARTGDAGLGGLSLLLVDANSFGVRMEAVPGLTWYSASNGTIYFDNVDVPADRLIGAEGTAFKSLAGQFNIERFSGVGATLAMARVATADAIAWARERETFGKRLVDHQRIRHVLIDMIRTINTGYAYLDQCVWRFNRGEVPIADLSMLKVQATRTLEFCAREAMQILGGEAYRGNRRVQRIQREARIFSLGGGTEEILNDLAARQLGF
ncbi:MAG: acyl-CoA dehydrogenase family protein [Gammaproteobacteria bacterium]|nr:acyl-CoA dehydrogenase family protein [Gammaproteobacteria bacterium]